MTTPQRLRTPLTELAGVDHPIVQTGMGWVSGASLVIGSANAGALGIIASATMNYAELEQTIRTVKEGTDRPFGVNLRSDAGDARERVELLIREHVAVASFALAPREDLIKQLKDAGIVVMPSVGAVRHAEKVAAWGADAVMVQGGEGGGHTGAIPTSLLVPSVVAAVDLPVIAAGGFSDGRGLAAALSWGAAGIGMGTRFLLTQDSDVPDAVKRHYLGYGLDGTVVTTKADGMPHRLLRTPFIEQLTRGSGMGQLLPTVRRSFDFKRRSGLSWPALARDAVAMKKASGRNWSQMMLAANTPEMLRAGLVEGDLTAGMLAAGQVVGVIDDIPTCEQLVDRIIAEAVGQLETASAMIVR
ncbi:nitronate monooxygenase family protein [Salinibacterium sp. ZJ70]|uniref:NAD(P)H-dependent flavin oxidoreductase n=1 Tax=Salinibacterium sp. ZJ70 TaxID=2708084 RepID=UPI0014229614|nr:nitronate monooxygenase [Salinibacterium sp. ZJ70]